MEVPMYRLISSLVIIALLSGCGPRKMPPGDIVTEKKAIESLVSNFWKAFESKNLAALTKLYTTSGDLMFFGTDSAEVIRTIAQWEAQVKNDWEMFQTVKFGELKNISTIVANDGELGSIVCETPVDMTVGGQQSHSLFRFAGTLRRENGEWRFVHGMVAMATVGQSSAEIVAKMKEEKAAPVKK
jgi:ketosteroid isomerase-like protein